MFWVVAGIAEGFGLGCFGFEFWVTDLICCVGALLFCALF